ncbi:MAG TPA: MbnH family di-heme enzyme [Polyangiaceae bacterium]|jgi:cytochrome c peroxidase|nr:MbnH family di-heme enzyme [Polyangiaceae bacterium]
MTRWLCLLTLIVGCEHDDRRVPVEDASTDAHVVPRTDAAVVVGASTGGAPSMLDARVEAATSLPRESGAVDAGGAFEWNLPPGFPVPLVPDDNPMTSDKVSLGRYLFYDVRLSHNQTESCSTCHQQALAFTDGKAHGVGSTGMVHPRGPMSLANVAYASTLTWANPLQTDLEHQALVPMFGDDPVELGLVSADELVARLATVPEYTALFGQAWHEDPAPITLAHVTQALASFERTLISGRSAYDRFQYGDTSALTDSAQRGYALFNSDEVGCFHCHVGFAFTDHVNWAGKAFLDRPYHNTGLYNIDGEGAYPEPNTGVEHVTHEPGDMGRFKAPTLRNIAVTAPYMHDGSVATLDEALDHYGAGGRTITSGPNAGHGNLNPLKDPVIQPFTLSAEQRTALIAFLNSLTDDAFLRAPTLSDPW